MTLCPICWEESEELLSIKPCKHEFHLYCIKMIIRPFCPLCNVNITKFLVTNRIIGKQELLKKCDNDDIGIINDMGDIIDDEDNRIELYDANFNINDVNNNANDNVNEFICALIFFSFVPVFILALIDKLLGRF